MIYRIRCLHPTRRPNNDGCLNIGHAKSLGMSASLSLCMALCRGAISMVNWNSMCYKDTMIERMGEWMAYAVGVTVFNKYEFYSSISLMKFTCPRHFYYGF